MSTREGAVSMDQGSEPFRSWADGIMQRVLADPDRVVVRAPGREVTGGELARMTFRYARALAVRGMGSGDRVAILADKSPEALAVRYAVGLVGAASTFSPDTGIPDRLTTFLRQVDPSLLVVFPSTATDGHAAVARSLARAVVSVGPVPGLSDLAEEAASQPGDAFAGRGRPDDLAVLIASGGTTGASKASMRSFDGYGRLLGKAATTDQRLLVCSAFAYVTQVVVARVLLGGGVVTLADRCDPVAMLERIEAERITHLCLVEPQLVDLVEGLEEVDGDISSLVRITHIGAPSPASMRRRVLARVGPILANTYGTSEAGMISALAPPEYDLGRPELLSSSGRPLPGVDVVVRRGDGSPADPGEEGAIDVRLPGMATGYLGRPHDPRFHDGWYATGDVGLLDENGYLFVRGRGADARTIGGSTVMPIDLENAACAHPDVLYAVALPVDEEVGRFGIVAQRSRRSALTAADLEEHLRDEVRAGWVASMVVVDELPLTEQGKPDRTALRSLLTS